MGTLRLSPSTRAVLSAWAQIATASLQLQYSARNNKRLIFHLSLLLTLDTQIAEDSLLLQPQPMHFMEDGFFRAPLEGRHYSTPDWSFPSREHARATVSCLSRRHHRDSSRRQLLRSRLVGSSSRGVEHGGQHRPQRRLSNGAAPSRSQKPEGSRMARASGYL